MSDYSGSDMRIQELQARLEAAEQERDKLKQELEDNYRADADIQELIGKLMAEHDVALKAVKVLHALLEQLQWQYFPMDDRADCPRCGCHEHVGHSQDCEIKIALSGDPAPDLVLVPKEQVRLAHELAEKVGDYKNEGDCRAWLQKLARAYLLEAEKESR